MLNFSTRLAGWIYLAIIVAGLIWLFTPIRARAMDWAQPMMDEEGMPIPDCPTDPKCGKILTVGRIVARILCLPRQGAPGTVAPEQASIECDFGKKILREPSTEATPDELKFVCDAIGRSPSPLVISDGYGILGCKKPVK